MAQSDIYANLRIGGIIAAFEHLRKLDIKAVLLKLRKPMHYDQRDHRDRQRGPNGPWQQLAASTKARYAREGKRRNRRILAKLPNARYTIVNSRSIRMRSRVSWSMAHQDGPTRVGRGSRIPQRQFLWISKRLKEEARRHFEAALWARWGQI
jgi:hypothetical protein